ncbi:hypothetical protein [Yinghuangia seranimata]|uniref:hypothetical protein n=1 Tax=Yinghuangia seranimata TaxID=408067 RepID=UPI00248C1F27|nr:hypothetical protein [Yinghuangia seranimata]MDI2131252.1 hypothetical protein [Yinghuangia seranimata]
MSFPLRAPSRAASQAARAASRSLAGAAAALLVLLVLPVSLVVGGAAPAGAAGEQSQLLAFKDDRITESSGLIASVRHPGVFWTHNDSGDLPRLFAVGADGATKAVITLEGVEPRDWEAVSVGKDEAGNPALFIGDIGDNFKGKWPEVWIYRIPEPAELKDATVKPVKYRVQYADGPRDAEALLVDPRSNKVYIASKENKGGLYEQPAALSPTGVNVFTRVADAPPTVTDGAFAPDGTRFILRGYGGATMYTAPGKPVENGADHSGDVPGAFQMAFPQGESVCFTADGQAVLFGSEGVHSTVRRVALDGLFLPAMAAAPGQPSGQPSGSGAPADPAQAGGGDQEGQAGRPATKAYGPGFLAVVVLVVTVYAFIKFRGPKSGSD